MPNTDARSRTASPSPASRRSSSSACGASSACGSGAAASVGSASASAAGSPTAASPTAASELSVPLTSLNDDRLPAPALLELVVADALVLDALLQEHDALDQRLGPRWAAR